MHESRFARTIASASIFGFAALVTGACSATDTAEEVSTCKDLQSLATQVRGLRDVDVVRTGVDGLEVQTRAISDAWGQAKATGEAQFGSELDGFETYLKALRTTLADASGGGATITETASAVRGDISKISASWDELKSAVDVELDDCDLSEE